MKRYFTSNYDKEPQSNVSKVIKLINDELEEVKELYNNIKSYSDIDNAQGKGLDLEGANIRQYRGEVNDDIYRVLIKSKIARNKANGTLNNLLEVLSMALGVDKSTIVLKEGVNTDFYSVSINEIPIETLANIGMSAIQLGRLINTMIASGIAIESAIFVGTFEYGDIPIENNMDIGYSNVDMTTGGELGDVYQQSIDDRFPL